MLTFRGVVGIVTILVVHVAALSLPLGGLGSAGLVKRISFPSLFERSVNDVRNEKPEPPCDDDDTNNPPDDHHTDMISSTTGSYPLSIIPYLSSTSGSITPVSTLPPVSTVSSASPPQGTNPPGSVDPKLVPPAIKTVCDGRQGIPQSVNQLMAFNVTITAGDCPSVQTTPQSSTISLTSSSSTISTTLLSPRAGCNYPPNVCAGYPGGGNLLGFAQCGARCDSNCYWGSGGPDPNDCEQIFSYFRSRSDPIFQVGANKFLLFTYKSCGTGIQNQVTNQSPDCNTSIIYDYPDWGYVGSYLAFNCQGTQGARGGKCQNPSNNFYIQVYRNG